MTRSLPMEQTAEPVAIDPAEDRDLQERLHDGGRTVGDEDASPQAFYERSVQREDVRKILERLAKG